MTIKKVICNASKEGPTKCIIILQTMVHSLVLTAVFPDFVVIRPSMIGLRFQRWKLFSSGKSYNLNLGIWSTPPKRPQQKFGFSWSLVWYHFPGNKLCLSPSPIERDLQMLSDWSKWIYTMTLHKYVTSSSVFAGIFCGIYGLQASLGPSWEKRARWPRSLCK